jgi:hypothetical protein
MLLVFVFFGESLDDAGKALPGPLKAPHNVLGGGEQQSDDFSDQLLA